MFRKGVVLLCFLGSVLFSEEFAFEGTHFLASYISCDDEALYDIATLQEVFCEAAEMSGATILQTASHEFSEGGFTMVILLSESHASIHTYPEHGSCFVDLFTCGTSCSFESFDYILRLYLNPKKASTKTLFREQKIHDFSK